MKPLEPEQPLENMIWLGEKISSVVYQPESVLDHSFTTKITYPYKRDI